MIVRPIPLFAAGAAAVAALALAGHFANGPRLIAGFERAAGAALDGTGVVASFRTSAGWLSRHPRLDYGDDVFPDARLSAIKRVYAIRGIGGISWSRPSSPTVRAFEGTPPGPHCQEQVEAILKYRTIRFAEGSAAFDPASDAVLGEVARALAPCRGSVIAIVGHTDDGGDEDANVALSFDRARAVREALVVRGIARTALRARGEGARRPREGLAASDPANRRIEFSVIFAAPLAPTPVDTPGAG